MSDESKDELFKDAIAGADHGLEYATYAVLEKPCPVCGREWPLEPSGMGSGYSAEDISMTNMVEFTCECGNQITIRTLLKSKSAQAAAKAIKEAIDSGKYTLRK